VPQLTTRSIDLKRVVITGMGTVNPMGNDVETTWEGLLKGVSGITPIERFPIEDYPVRFAGQVEDLDVSHVIEKKEARRLDLYLQYALIAADEAMLDSGFKVTEDEAERVGVLIGSGIAGLQTMLDNCEALVNRGWKRVSPFFVPHTICNMASGLAAIRFGARGPNSCVVTACTTGTHAVGDAYRMVQRGEADVVIAGGCEAPVNPLGIAGFASMRALSTRNDDPQHASRPFDAERDGFVIAEGAGIAIVESLEHALARGARIHAEVVGYGMSGDAYHMSAPAEDGRGAKLCMRNAIADARVEPSAVDYVNAHGTSTPYNDKIETLAIREVFGAHAEKLAISSTKSMTGHLLGGAGGLEAIVCALAVREGKIPPTINYTTPDPACDLDYVPNEMREVADLRLAISNSFGFGGTNATIAIARYEE
jgi:3-oxoacyl-[acyl-carrier-protein] synthase II